MVRKIECPTCKLIMPYTKLHEHRRGDVCWRVWCLKKKEDFTYPNSVISCKKKGKGKSVQKRAEKTVKKIMQKASS